MWLCHEAAAETWGEALKASLCLCQQASFCGSPSLFVYCTWSFVSSVICQCWPLRSPFCVPKISQSTPVSGPWFAMPEPCALFLSSYNYNWLFQSEQGRAFCSETCQCTYLVFQQGDISLGTLIFWSDFTLQEGGASHKEPVYSQPNWSIRISSRDMNQEPKSSEGLRFTMKTNTNLEFSTISHAI